MVRFLQHRDAMTVESRRVFGLDVMRAAAISLVLIGHVTLFFPRPGAFFTTGLLAGYFGVELFFVLSGFLIGGILLKTLSTHGSPPSLLSFWLRRWFRTLPNYFLFLLVNVGIAVWLGAGVPSFWKFLFFLQNFVEPAWKFFPESWSLAIEEWFYLFVPIVLFAAIAVAPRRFRVVSLIIIVAAIGAVTVARIMFVSATHPQWLTGVRIIVVYRLDACMFGVFAAWVKHFHPEIWQKRVAFVFCLGALLLSIVAALPFVLSPDSLFMQGLGFTLTSLGAAMLLPLFDTRMSAKGVLGVIVTKVSTWSYSLYLVNFPVYIVLREMAPNRSPVLLSIALLFVSTLLAGFIYTFYERPAMDLRESFALRRPHRGFPATAIANN